MVRQLSYRFHHRLTRFAVTGLLTLQGTIALTLVPEMTATIPGANLTSTAMAQDAGAAQGVYRKVAPAVVYVETEDGSGSGVIVDANGLIVTNAHVVQDSRQITVELHDGRKFPASIVSLGSANCLDLAALKIEATHLPKLKLGSSNSIQKGQPIYAIGYPRGRKPASITQGIVVYNTDRIVHIDAALIPGNSGGALVNSRGELIGINTSKGVDVDSGVNLAIAVDMVQALLHAHKQGVSPTIASYVVPANVRTGEALTQSLPLDGSIKTGRLQPGSSQVCEDGSYANIYTFKGEAYQPFEIRMSSADVGSYLLVLGPNGERIARSAVKRRNEAALVIEELPETGTYTVIANAADKKQTGTYRLQATTPVLVKRDRLDRNAPACMDDGSPCRNYEFTAKAGTVTIALHKFDFDPYLVVMDANGKIVAKGKAERKDVISVKLPKDGTYKLIVSTVNPRDQGQFFLSVHAPDAEKGDRLSRSAR